MNNLEITSTELQTLLGENKPVFILDVRPSHERNEWYIPESTHFDVYEALKAGDEAALDAIELPEDQPVITVCGGGRVSLTVAKILQNKGIKSFSLQGGMKAWNYAWNTAELKVKDSHTRIIQVRRAAKGCLSYVIGSEDEAVVVDAALNPGVYLDIARRYNWRITRVMDTHIHADYISRTRELAAESGTKHIMIDKAETDFAFAEVKHGQIISFGKSRLRVLHTPGHTRESTSYLVDEKILLTGDTLFVDGVGRPDLKADQEQALKKAGQLYESLQTIISLPEETVILPAHISRPVPFNKTMIKATLKELKSALDLLQLSRAEFMEATLKRIPEPPENYLTIAELNKKGSHEEYKLSELEVGANRCAVS